MTGTPGAISNVIACNAQAVRQPHDARVPADHLAAIAHELFERINARTTELVSTAARGIEIEHVDDRLRDIADKHRLKLRIGHGERDQWKDALQERELVEQFVFGANTTDGLNTLVASDDANTAFSPSPFERRYMLGHSTQHRAR